MNLAFHFGWPSAGLRHHPDGVSVTLANAIIAGCGHERWAEGVGGSRECAALTLWRDGEELWGMGVADVTDHGFDEAAHKLYRDIFRATDDLTLYRVWNFIPRINECDGELENYRAFCRGRYRAFSHRFGAGSERRMPAASAVGTPGDGLCAVFLAGTAATRYVENPHQLPAYRYPARYGPRAPSFARASMVESPASRRLYVSGTASIRGSDSLHVGDVSAQIELALDNVDAVARAAGLDGLDRHSDGRRLFRLYLRHPEHWEAVRPVLERRLQRDDDRVNVIQADICRRELLAEVEAFVAL